MCLNSCIRVISSNELPFNSQEIKDQEVLIRTEEKRLDLDLLLFEQG